MDQRDRAFLHDMREFICLNRLATILAFYRTTAEPDIITTLTMKILDVSLSCCLSNNLAHVPIW
jgi:hypothetical protein